MLQSFFKYIFPDRDQFPVSFAGELHYQSSRIIFPASLICVFAWLNYIKIDTQLHPEQPLIVWLRLGLTAVGLVIFFLQWFRFFKQRSMWLLFPLGFYLLVACGVLTGLTKGDSEYMGGYFFILMIPLIAPMRTRLLWIMLVVSVVSFLLVGFGNDMRFETVRELYKLNDLVVVFLCSLFFSYISGVIRYRSWQKSRTVEEQKSRIEEEKAKTDSIIAEAKKVVEYVSDASLVIRNFYGHVSDAVREQAPIFAQSRESGEQLLVSFEKLKADTGQQLNINNTARELTQDLRVDLHRTAETGKTAIDEAHKIQALSDECNRKLQSAQDAIGNLKEESTRIEEISKTINEIADRTNLLSLNASIESARAGEHGKGFAVVAEEISKLADSSITSAKEIGLIIHKSVARINTAAEQISETSLALKEIILFLESNREFLQGFEGLIREQDQEVERLIAHFEGFADYTRAIDELGAKNANEVESSKAMIGKIESFHTTLTDMSRDFLDLAEDLGGYVDSLRKTLQ